MKIERAQVEDALNIISWFPDKESVILWGSPYTRYPLSEDTLFEDIYWDRIDSFVARTEDGTLLGFGQYYPKLNRCHLARLVINPQFRGQGLGEEFVAALMERGSRDLETDGFSLYVMTANKPAYNCYHALGFHITPYPHGDMQLENCIFMTAEVGER